MMLGFIAVMAPLVFVINGLSKGNWFEALLFAVAVAVGLTPEMLPMIVTVNLAKGAMAMSKKKGHRQAAQRHPELRGDGRVVIHENTAVLHVGRRGLLKGDHLGDARRGKEPFRLLLRDDKGRERVEEADVVLDCTGVYGHPRRLGDGGVPALGEAAARPYVAFGLEDVAGERDQHYADKTILVIGSGCSAATTVSPWPPWRKSTRRRG